MKDINILKKIEGKLVSINFDLKVKGKS